MAFVNELNLNIKIDYATKLSVKIFDLKGRVVLNDDSRFVIKGTNDLRLDVDYLAPGLYILVVDTGKEKITKKVMSGR